MAIERARKVASLPLTREVNCVYIVDTADIKVKTIVITDAAGTPEVIGDKTGFMVNKKLLAAA